MAVFQRRPRLGGQLHLHRLGQGPDLVPEDGLKAHGHMVPMVPVQSRAFPAAPVPFTQSVGSGTPGHLRVGGQSAVFQDQFVILFLCAHDKLLFVRIPAEAQRRRDDPPQPLPPQFQPSCCKIPGTEKQGGGAAAKETQPRPQGLRPRLAPDCPEEKGERI